MHYNYVLFISLKTESYIIHNGTLYLSSTCYCCPWQPTVVHGNHQSKVSQFAGELVHAYEYVGRFDVHMTEPVAMEMI